MDYDCIDKFIYSLDSEEDYNMIEIDIDSDLDSEFLDREKYCLFSFVCYLGDIIIV